MKRILQLKTMTVTSAALGITTMLFSGSAFAQDRDEIIVTARKQAQNIQDVPLAITALSEVEIQAAGYDDIIDISKAAPGLFIETINSRPARIDASPRFRGVVFDSFSPLNRTATVFVDGVLTSGGIQSLGFNEIERVEIIKGPQSALFGRNTFSGAINYITKDPAKEFQGKISALGATEDEYRIGASIEGPIAGDTITGRIGGEFKSHAGHYDNAANPGQKLGDEESLSLSAVLAFNPNDNFRAKLRGSYYENEDGPAAVIRVAGRAEHNFGGFALPGGGTTETAFRGTVRTPTDSEIALNTSAGNFDTFLTNLRDGGRQEAVIGLTFDDLGGYGLKREGFRLSGDATYDFSDDVSFDVLVGYNEDEYLGLFDFDGTDDYSFSVSAGQEVKDLSLEARLSGTLLNDRVDWSFGANYLDVDILVIGGFRDDAAGFFFPNIYNDPSVTGAETFGVFGTLDFAVTDKITAIFEGRYQVDKIFDDGVPLISPGEFKKFLPRVLLQYEPSDDTTLYANYSIGNLPGGFNSEVAELDATQLAELAAENPGVGQTYKEEKLENFEIGLKKAAFNGDLAFNLAAFYMKRSDQIFSGFQLVTDTNPAPGSTNPFRTVSFTDNGATSNIKGFELDGTLRATDNLTLQGSLAYVDAKIASFPPNTNSGDFSAVFGLAADVKGQRSPRFPEWAGSVSATYERPLENSLFGGSADWYTRGDLFYTGEFFDETTNLAENSSAVDVNLRTGIRRDNVSVELFVTNLFEETSPVSANNVADTSFDVRFVTGFYDFSQESVHVALRDKRQFGVRVDVDF